MYNYHYNYHISGSSTYLYLFLSLYSIRFISLNKDYLSFPLLTYELLAHDPNRRTSTKDALHHEYFKLNNSNQGVIYWGGGGEGSTPNSTSFPAKVLNKKITRSAVRTYTELDQLSDQTLNDIIDKYKYTLLNTRHA